MMKKLLALSLMALLVLFVSPKPAHAACSDPPAPFVNWSGCDKSDVNLSGENLSGANLSGATLSFANLTGADLTSATLNGADVIFANLTGADLTSATLNGAGLLFANLTNANLTNANLIGADLSGATGNVPTGVLAVHNNTICPSGIVRSDPQKCWTPTAVTLLQQTSTTTNQTGWLVGLLVVMTGLGVLTTAVVRRTTTHP